MALRHIALFRWIDGITPEQVAAVQEGLAALPAAIPELDAYAFGPDLGLGTGNFDFAVVADVADEAAYAVYRDHPRHQEVLAVIRPLLADRAAVQVRI
ncbi:Dabb family protein [Nocardiopsis mangrovi]|uniref:Dabb family protein n=1 Tax=Nocardiopsis mangrovi TaxID=1179818 RepID=A0ABV9E0L3_9ACTN